jgi:hypothetical protein
VIVPKFKIGDQVERVGSLVPIYMQSGTVVRVTPNNDGADWMTEYEVNFGNRFVAVFYETQLRLIPPGDKFQPPIQPLPQ